MKIRHIEIFHAVYRHKTISSAARNLKITQPAVSKALRHAEDYIGFPLFTRTGRGLVPTEQAHLLFDDVSKVFAGVARVQQATQDLRNVVGGRLKISTVTGLSYEILPKAVARVRKSHPNTVFELQTLHYSDLIASLRDFDTHIGLVFEAPTHNGLVKKPLGQCEFACIYQKDKFKVTSLHLKLKNILEQKFISLNPSGPLGTKIWEEISNTNTRIEAVALAESCFVAKSMAACDVGVAIVDEFTACAPGFDHLDNAKITPSITIEIDALYLESRPLLPIAKVFLKALEEEIQLWHQARND